MKKCSSKILINELLIVPVFIPFEPVNCDPGCSILKWNVCVSQAGIIAVPRIKLNSLYLCPLPRGYSRSLTFKDLTIF